MPEPVATKLLQTTQSTVLLLPIILLLPWVPTREIQESPSWLGTSVRVSLRTSSLPLISLTLQACYTSNVTITREAWQSGTQDVPK